MQECFTLPTSGQLSHCTPWSWRSRVQQHDVTNFLRTCPAGKCLICNTKYHSHWTPNHPSFSPQIRHIIRLICDTHLEGSVGGNKGQGTGVRGTDVFLFWAVQNGEGFISTWVTIVYSQGSIGYLTILQSTKRRASYPYRSVARSCLPPRL